MNQFYTSLEKIFWLVALGFIIFFVHWNLKGLQPDAALYAGLSYKVLKSAEFWKLAGTDAKFPIYFEHPPFFFQWGSYVLKLLGVSDGAARAIGGIPGLLGFLILTFWTYWRMGWKVAFLTAIGLASFGHYTKYATTSMLEAPLSLGVVLTAISTYELHWRSKTGWKRPLFWLPLFLGLALATAAKGVAGLGAWGGMLLSMMCALFFSEREPFKVLFSIFFTGIALLVSLSPLAFWAYKMFQTGGQDWISGYFTHQVLRSFNSNRGEVTHALHGDHLYYLKLFFRDSWPWGWTFPLAWIFYLGRRWLPAWKEKFEDKVFKAWLWNSTAFFLAYLLPFSFVSFQLPHYLHPSYLVLAPTGAYFFYHVIVPQDKWKILYDLKLRWGALVLLMLGLFLTSQGISKNENRGQDFILLQEQIEKVPLTCSLLTEETSMDAYRMEAFSLWYLRGRPWAYVEREFPARIAVPRNKLFWNPAKRVIWGNNVCAI